MDLSLDEDSKIKCQTENQTTELAISLRKTLISVYISKMAIWLDCIFVKMHMIYACKVYPLRMEKQF